VGNPTLITGANPVTLPAPQAGTYTIVESQLPLVGGLGGHNLQILVAPDGTPIAELDGLATSSSGAIQPIGFFSSSLKVYETSGTYLYNPSEVQGTIASGSYEQIMGQWNAAVSCGQAINSENLSYPFLGLGSNSNSVESTLTACMGVTEPTGVSTNALFTPGVGTMLLSPDTIKSIQTENGVSTSSDSTINTYPSITSEQTTASGTTIDVNGGNGTTEVATIAPSSAGGGVASLTTLSASGTTLNVTTDNVNASNVGTITVSGTGAVENISGETITVAAGSTVTIIGSGDTINAGNGANVTIGGNGSAGTADTVNLSSGTVTLDANSRAAVDGTGDVVNAASSDNLGVYGGSDTVNGVSGDGIWVGQNGATTTATDTVNASGATVTIAANSRVNVMGSSDTVDGQSTDNFGVYGGSDTVNGVSGDSIWVGQNGETTSQTDTVNASNSTVTLASNSRVNVFGSSDTVDGQSADNFGVYGNGDTVNGVSGDSVWVGSNGTVGAFDGVNVSNATVTVAANSQVNLSGSADNVALTTGDSVGVYGGGNTVSSAASDLVVLGNTNGSADTVNASGDVSGSTTANGQGTGVYLNANTQANINGSHDSLSGGTGDTVTVDGTYDPFNGSSDTISYSGSNIGDIVTGSGDTGSDWSDPTPPPPPPPPPPIGDGDGDLGDGGDDSTGDAVRGGTVHTASTGKSLIGATAFGERKWAGAEEGVFVYGEDEGSTVQHSASASQSADQLIQSMASFGAPSAALSWLSAVDKEMIHAPFLAVVH
jgi:hypothetical protein